MSELLVPPTFSDALMLAKKAHLRYISDKVKGYKRQRNDKEFIYFNTRGEKIKDPITISRIEQLVIPPAWEDVWISPDHNSHIQATGKDEKGRKQYIYHEEWNKMCQQNKFDKMVFFGYSLPKIRRKVREHMASNGLSKEKILATLVWLLSNTFIRIGNEEYAKENNSYGLTTLRSKHIDFDGTTSVTLSFKGKSGVEHIVEVTNPKVIKTIKKCIELPGYELFKYVDENGKRKIVDSAEVNDYLRDITGEDVSAKYFRTWGGTVLSAETLHKCGPYENKVALKKNLNQAVKEVSQHLRNTTTVCRCYYIHPTIITSYEKQTLIPHFEKSIKKGEKYPGLTMHEYATLTLLER